MGRLRRVSLEFDDREIEARVLRLLSGSWRGDGAERTWTTSESDFRDDRLASLGERERAEILVTDRSSAGDGRAILALGPLATGTLWLPSDAEAERVRAALDHLCLWLDQRDEREFLRAERTRLLALARVDPLTQLANRNVWNESLAEAVVEARASGRALLVAIVDLDAFKQVNERLGLSEGDRWLVAAAQALRDRLSQLGDQSTVAARWGGDEFAILAPYDQVESPHDWVDNLRRAVVQALEAACAKTGDLASDAAQPVVAPRTTFATAGGAHWNTPVRTTASAGWALSQFADLLSADELFAAAERALREAKRAGGDRTVGPVS